MIRLKIMKQNVNIPVSIHLQKYVACLDKSSTDYPVAKSEIKICRKKKIDRTHSLMNSSSASLASASGGN